MSLGDFSAPRRNIEIKSRLHDLDQARRVAADLSGGAPQILRQRDTYFQCAQGRLKLREFAGAPAELIAYMRPDSTAPRTSQYRIVPVADAGVLGEALTIALGVLVVVEKVRELSLYKNVRIHLDQVAQLGTFLEFEAVLDPATRGEEGESLVRQLADRFGLRPDDLTAGSYSDLLLRTKK